MDLFVCEKWVARGSVDGSEAWKVSGGWLVGGWLAAGRSDARDMPVIRCVMCGKVS